MSSSRKNSSQNEAAAQFELWTGQKAPKELMTQAAYSALVANPNQ